MCVCLYSTDVSRYYMACLSTYKGERGANMVYSINYLTMLAAFILRFYLGLACLYIY